MREIAGYSGGDLGSVSDVRFRLRDGLIAVVLVVSEDAGSDWALDRVTDL